MLHIEKPKGLQAARLRVMGLASTFARGVLGIEQTQIVVCGFPRSGTSLLYNMLSSSLPRFIFEDFEKYFIHRIHRLGNIATKAPMDVLHIQDIDKLNTNKKNLVILIVVRDIRDVITSIHPIYNDEYFIGYDNSWWPQDKSLESWKYDAPGVLDIHDAILNASKREDCLVVRYEDLVANPNLQQERIQHKFGLRFDSDFDQYHISPDKHAYRYEGRYKPADEALVRESSEVTTNRVSRWITKDEHIRRVVAQFRACSTLFEVLEHYGYEKDRSWFNDVMERS